MPMEYGIHWNNQTPRWAVSRLLENLHLSTSFPDVCRELHKRMDENNFPDEIRRETIRYARVAWLDYLHLYKRVMHHGV